MQFSQLWNVFIILERNPNDLRNLPRMPLAKIDEKVYDAFRVTNKERERSRRLEHDLQTKYPIDQARLKGMEKMIGIRAVDIKNMMNKDKTV